MDSPTHISGNRVLLHEPKPSWQQSGGQAINEGPEILVHNERTFLIYCMSMFYVSFNRNSAKHP
jgi:GH43 family beta-xylosidase